MNHTDYTCPNNETNDSNHNCQECCQHDDTDHNYCLDCGKYIEPSHEYEINEER
jgi:hypothetical protein